MYYITLRSVFAEEAVASENNQTYDRLVQVACRRNRIGACDKKEARQIRDVLVYYRKLLLEKNVYILDIFTRMIETINVQRIRPAKWKRYLKKSLSIRSYGKNIYLHKKRCVLAMASGLVVVVRIWNSWQSKEKLHPER